MEILNDHDYAMATAAILKVLSMMWMAFAMEISDIVANKISELAQK